MWMQIHTSTPGESWLLCAIVGPPGGDIDFWTELVSEYTALKQLGGIKYTIVFGDANIHLPGLVNHHHSCKCAHCRPSRVDATIAHILQAAHLHCVNPPDKATHVSGTIIDLLLTDNPVFCFTPIVSAPDVIAMSDHGLVAADVACTLRINCSSGFGRVWWASYGDWDSVLGKMDSAFHGLACIIKDLAADPSLVLAANMWLRDA